jgi:hypothetical protein
MLILPNMQTMHSSILGNYVSSIFEFVEELPEQEEGDNHDDDEDDGNLCVLLASDTKLFWRSSDNVFIDAYLHQNYNCVEVVLQYSTGQDAVISIYLDYHLLKANLHRLHGHVRNLKIYNENLSQYIDERLHQDKDRLIVFRPLKTDPSDIIPVLPTKPAPVLSAGENVENIRQSLADKIDAAVEGLQGDGVQLRVATYRAGLYSLATRHAVDEVQRIQLLPLKPDMVKQVSAGKYSPVEKVPTDWTPPNRRSIINSEELQYHSLGIVVKNKGEDEAARKLIRGNKFSA